MHKIQVHGQNNAGLSNSYNPNAYYPQMISQTVSDSYFPMGYSHVSFEELRRYTCGYCGKRLDSRSGMDVRHSLFSVIVSTFYDHYRIHVGAYAHTHAGKT